MVAGPRHTGVFSRRQATHSCSRPGVSVPISTEQALGLQCRPHSGWCCSGGPARRRSDERPAHGPLGQCSARSIGVQHRAPVREARREHPRDRRLHGSRPDRRPGLLDPRLHQPADRGSARLSARRLAERRGALARRPAPRRPRAHGQVRRARAGDAVGAVRRVPHDRAGRACGLGRREGGSRHGSGKRCPVLAGSDGRHHRPQVSRDCACGERAPVPVDLRCGCDRGDDGRSRRPDPGGQPDAGAGVRLPVRRVARPDAERLPRARRRLQPGAVPRARRRHARPLPARAPLPPQ